MQDRSFQDEVPKERINIKFVKDVGDAKEAVELPLKLLMLGDYSLREGGPDLAERKRISVNKENFEDN